MPLVICTEIMNFDSTGESYFHPRATILEDSSYMMTLQTISGSDYFGPVQVCHSNGEELGRHKPELIPGMGRILVCNEIEEGVCDVVPDFHPPTGTILAIGHNVYYKNSRLYDSLADWHPEDGPTLNRFIVYTVKNKNGIWSGERKRLECPAFANCSIFTCGCSQKVITPDGYLLIPVSFGFFGKHDRMATCLLCEFNGDELKVIKRGSTLTNPVGRGLLEPSIAEFRDRYYMTLRAEDDHGYVSVSDDGLNWQDIKPWQWEDGMPLTMSTTQQHWLELGGKLYLIYTRKNGVNGDVFRWRAPLLLAEFDPEKLCLKKTTEQTVFPMRPDPQNRRSVGLMGNFHPLAVSEHEAIVTVGEMRPDSGFTGDTILARIKVD